jgi:hypothetical protein
MIGSITSGGMAPDVPDMLNDDSVEGRVEGACKNSGSVGELSLIDVGLRK